MPTNTWISVTQDNLTQLAFAASATPGTESVDVRVFDGAWSPYQTVTVTTEAIAPILTTTTATEDSNNASSPAQALIDNENSQFFNGFPTTSFTYAFKDIGSGGTGDGGYFTVNGVAQPFNTWFEVSYSQIGNVDYVGAPGAGSEQVDVKVYDGGAWSNVSVGTEQTLAPAAGPPTLVVQNASVFGDQVFQSASLIASATADSGATITQYEFIDNGDPSVGGTDSGTFVLNGVPQATGVAIDVSAADLGNLVYQAGSLADRAQIDVQATDSNGLVSKIQVATLSTLQNLAPDLNVANQVVNASSTIAAASLILIVDDQISEPLYGATNAPVPGDVNQGVLGDCYLMASMAEVASVNPAAIESMITNNYNGTYGVGFFINGAPVYITVDSNLPYEASGTAPGSSLGVGGSPVLWPGLIEKAYAQLNQESTDGTSGIIGDGHTAGNIWDLINGGHGDPLQQITDDPVTSYNINGANAATLAADQTIFVNALNAGAEIDFASYGSLNVDGVIEFVGPHMYSGLSFDATSGEFVVRNPWGNDNGGQGFVAQFEATIQQMAAVHGTVYVSQSASTSGLPNVSLDTGNAPVGATAAPPWCAAGTRIATSAGDVAVEALRVGTEVMLAHGGTAPVVWLGARRVNCRAHPRPWDVMVWQAWTDGDAELAVPGIREIAFDVAMAGTYWEATTPRTPQAAPEWRRAASSGR